MKIYNTTNLSVSEAKPSIRSRNLLHIWGHQLSLNHQMNYHAAKPDRNDEIMKMEVNKDHGINFIKFRIH